VNPEIRKTSQYELPVRKSEAVDGYDVYPVHSIGDNKIQSSYHSLAARLPEKGVVKLDGYVGILFEEVRRGLTQALEELNIDAHWITMEDALLPNDQVQQRIAPYLGGDDPIFGKVCPLSLNDFFDTRKLKEISSATTTQLTIYYGSGAALVPGDGTLVYFDIAKNEIQFRARAGTVHNIGAREKEDSKRMYKHFYFVDWIVLNRHLKSIINDIDIFVDGQRSDEITWIAGEEWRKEIQKLPLRPIRVRPWFEPGIWGGTWIKEHIDGLETNVINYAWSFELITPENGVVLESNGLMLETSFDALMYLAGGDVLGVDAKKYGDVFPIRFDFLDTFNGANLSVQCHPKKEYMLAHFGEPITQEETYYILDRQKDATVFLGLQQGVTKEKLKSALEHSFLHKEPIAIEQIVQSFPAEKHALYLIPPGTIHASGKDTLVLEISATPYIYTFKLYDWLRLDLDGKPRPLNIDRGMENIELSYSGNYVPEKLIAHPVVLDNTANYDLVHLPTHKEHLYDVHRYRLINEVEVRTNNKVHVLSLVEGTHIEIIIDGNSFRYAYAETVIIPARVNNYTIRNADKTPALVIKAFIK